MKLSQKIQPVSICSLSVILLSSYSISGNMNKSTAFLCLVIALFQQCAGQTCPPIPAKPIPGTNLLTGTWYTIDLKNPTNPGRLTWAEAKEKDGHHVQMVWGGAAKEFQAGEKYWPDSQWMIVPSEKAGFYMLINGGLLDSVTTWEGKSASGKWVVAIKSKLGDKDYQAKGQYRDDALWRFESPDGKPGKFYTIYNNRFPNNGIMTWANQDVVAGKKYVQIYTDGSANEYKKNSDYLWEFKPVTE